MSMNPCHRSRAYAASMTIQAHGAVNAVAGAKIALIGTGLDIQCHVFQVLFVNSRCLCVWPETAGQLLSVGAEWDFGHLLLFYSVHNPLL